MQEIWKDVIGYEGLYQVSNLGIIKSNTRIVKRSRNGDQLIHERILKPMVHPKGYHHVALYKYKSRKDLKLHRLVGLHFIPNPFNKPEINHINGIKSDNRVENLEWCTAKENTIHAWETGLKSSKKGYEHPNSMVVLQFSKEGNLINEFGSLLEAGRETGIHASNIHKCIKGKRNHAGGYVWKYKKEAV